MSSIWLTDLPNSAFNQYFDPRLVLFTSLNKRHISFIPGDNWQRLIFTLMTALATLDPLGRL